MNYQDVIEAKLLHIIFHNESNGYAVLKFIAEDGDDFIAVGYVSNIQTNEYYRLFGSFSEHPRYGFQFQFHGYEQTLRKDYDSLVRFFSGPLFKGIGKATARFVVDTLGMNAIQLIHENPAVLNQISGLSEKKHEVILSGVKTYLADEDPLVSFFARYGINGKMAVKIEHEYGENAPDRIRENPYRLIYDIEGVGFQSADKIAMEIGFDTQHPHRIRARIVSLVMDLCMRTGDTYIDDITLETAFNKEFPNIDIYDYLDDLCNEQLIYIENSRIYHHTQYLAEQGISNFLFNFVNFNDVDDYQISENFVGEHLSDIESELNIQYDESQKEAIYMMAKNEFSILTGGPGTGKTTIVQGIIQLYRKMYPSHVISICAPTGRASKRLSQLCECEASTIHSLLKWDLESNVFQVNEKDPLVCDFLIIDEFSMVDQWIFYHLLKASRNVKKILIIGDENQLPSVGCGCVLKDLIESECFPITRLHKIYRQKEGSDVIALADEMNRFEMGDLQRNDVRFYECASHQVKSYILKLVFNAIEKGYRHEDIQVLAPMYAGVCGIDALNVAMQQMLNPAQDGKKEVKIGYKTLREGDKVMQLKNQPDDHVYNGDIGFIVSIEKTLNDPSQVEICVDFDGNLVCYGQEDFINLTHAYAISIHKSQGSEYSIVMMPVVPEFKYMLNKRLLYTGITRAKKSLVLLGNELCFRDASKMKERYLRKSYLKQKLKLLFE